MPQDDTKAVGNVLAAVNRRFGTRLESGQILGSNIVCKDHQGKRHVIIGSCPNGTDYVVRGVVKQRGSQRMRWDISGQASTGSVQVSDGWGEHLLWVRDYRSDNPTDHIPQENGI